MSIDRLGISLLLLAMAAASLVVAHRAIADKMIFLSGTVAESMDVTTAFNPESGSLTIDPKGSHSEALKVEVVSTSPGRSPASDGPAARVMKRVLLTKPTSIELARLLPKHGTIQIRVLAP
jgi:hypothetical protein